MSRKIYKILTPKQWEDALAKGVSEGAPVDIADGYIHFSTGDQVEETAAKHFRGQGPLILVSFDIADFGDDLKWEPSRGGWSIMRALFDGQKAVIPDYPGKTQRDYCEDLPIPVTGNQYCRHYPGRLFPR